MRNAFFVLAIVVLAAIGQLAGAQVAPAVGIEALHGITVSGSAEVSAAPDVAYLVLGVRTRAGNAADAARTNAAAMNKVMDALTRAGVVRADIETVQYTLSPAYEYPREGPAKLVGYEATNMVRVTVRDLTKVGALIDGASGAGANVIQDVTFSVRDESAFRQRALTQAAQDAKGKAETIARGFGVRLGKLLDVNEAGAPIVIPFVAKAEAGAAPGTPISPQQVQVRANLTATYAIAP